MDAPVWFLIARVDVTGSSTGYFRALLIDQFIRHFFDWWLVGTESNAGWGEDMWDLSNQFVAEGFTGGLLTFIWFITMISRCFGRLGDKLKTLDGDRRQEWSQWLLGVALFGHNHGLLRSQLLGPDVECMASLLAIIVASTACATASPAPEPVQEPVQALQGG